MDAPIEKVFEKVRKRAPWIQRQQRFFTQFHPRTPEPQYVAGETHLYLGRQYKLKVEPHIKQQVKLYRGRLIVHRLSLGTGTLQGRSSSNGTASGRK
jgi:predicted metal-dependent hydrolase